MKNLIYLSYANDPNHPLPSLSKEDEDVYRVLSEGALQNKYNIHREPFATSLSGIAKYLILYRENLMIFHFSGHTSGNAFLLDDEQASSEGLGQLLSQCPNLRLVVLNGVHSISQVNNLLSSGIPIVIATRGTADDQSTVVFSKTFYEALSSGRTIKDAFEIGISFIKNMLGQEIEVERGLPSRHKDFPGYSWGIYFNDDIFLDYKLPSAPTTQVEQIKSPDLNELEAKLLVVGAGGAGKTTLIKKLHNPDLEVPNQEPSTHGIDIYNYSFIRKREDIEYRVKSRIWDFGGQEIYHSTHQFFLTHQSLYLLVSDNRKEDLDFDYWLYTIALLGQGSPILIILNEKDGRKRELNISALRRHFPSLENVLTVNFANNSGLRGLEEAVQDHLTELGLLVQNLSDSWHAVRKELEADDRNYINLDVYLKICRECGAKNENEAREISRILHVLGIVLHFQNDFILDNTIFLNPNWCTKAVYEILDSSAIIKNNGEFSLESLRQIWSAADYPRHKHVELLQLMKNFKLCYPVDEKRQLFLAPQLLSPEIPIYNFPKDQVLQYQYSYAFMPKGIISRFIAIIHDKIKNRLVWKNGVILQIDQSEAEIKENLIFRRLDIKIFGSKRKELLFYIRENLKSIHDQFTRLEYKELVPCICVECRGAIEPKYYELSDLEKAKSKGKSTIECRRSFEDIPLASLLDSLDLFAVNIDSLKDFLVKSDFTGFFKLLLHSFENTILYDEAVMINGRYSKFELDKHNGIIDYDTERITLNRIRVDCISLLEKAKRSSQFE